MVEAGRRARRRDRCLEPKGTAATGVSAGLGTTACSRRASSRRRTYGAWRLGWASGVAGCSLLAPAVEHRARPLLASRFQTPDVTSLLSCLALLHTAAVLHTRPREKENGSWYNEAVSWEGEGRWGERAALPSTPAGPGSTKATRERRVGRGRREGRWVIYGRDAFTRPLRRRAGEGRVSTKDAPSEEKGTSAKGTNFLVPWSRRPPAP